MTHTQKKDGGIPPTPLVLSLSKDAHKPKTKGAHGSAQAPRPAHRTGYSRSMIRPDLLLVAPMPHAIVETLAGHFTIHDLWNAADKDALLAEIGPAIRGIASNPVALPLDGALFDRLPRLEIVSNYAVGYDNIAMAEAARRGIVVTNTPGVLDAEVADFTLGLTLATIREIPQADRFVRRGQWRGGAYPLSSSLQGRRAGILGLGNIGKAVARRLEACDVPVAYSGRHRQDGVPYPYYPDAVSLAEACDLLIVIVPGGDGTRHLVNDAVLTALGPQGVLINVARGSVVDEAALIAALQNGTIQAAGIDVFAHEPHVPEALIALENTVLLPHIGSGSRETRAAMGQLMIDNLVNWFTEGKALTPVG